jgi:hypothetical protein
LESLKGVTDCVLYDIRIRLCGGLGVGLAAVCRLVNRVIGMMRAPIVGGCLAGLLILLSDSFFRLLGLPLGEFAISLFGRLGFRLATGLGRGLGLGSVGRAAALRRFSNWSLPFSRLSILAMRTR